MNVVGAVLGTNVAIQTVRAGALGSNVIIGLWQTGLDLGTADASANTRAIVALRGLLAPAAARSTSSSRAMVSRRRPARPWSRWTGPGASR